MASFIKNHPRFVVVSILFFILLFIIFMIPDKTDNDPQQFTVYVISDFSDSTSSSKNMLAAFKEEMGIHSLQLNGVDVRIEDRDDAADPLKAAYIADEISKREETLLVVGHFSSTPTKAALPAYLSADPPIPVILTTETNPHLIPSKYANDQCPVFRLSPNDISQAKTAARFARSKNSNNSVFWVVEDVENAVYSGFLTLEFIRELQGEVGEEWILYTKNDHIPPSQSLRTLNISFVFFAGSWQNALTLIRKIKPVFSEKMPMILLSDAAVDKNLLSAGKDIMQNVYLISPMSAQKYINDEYNLYGKDAAVIVKELITRAGNNSIKDLMRDENYIRRKIIQLFGIKSVPDARYILNHLMEDDIISRRPYNGYLEDHPFFFDKEGYKQFSHQSNRSTPVDFHIWQIRRVAPDSLQFVEMNF